MPLRKGSSRRIISENIRELHTGDTYAHTMKKFGKRRADKQSVAIALDVARRVKRAEGGEVSFDDRFTEPYRETADDLSARARNSLRTQPQRLESVVPDKTEEVGGPLIGDGGQFSPGVPAVNNFVNRVAERTASLPRSMMEGAVHDAAVPGAGLKPNPYPEGSEGWYWYNDQLQQAAQQWGPSMALNTMGAGLPFAEAGAAGIFGGRLAQTADHAALARAEKLAEAGVDRRAIFNDTGWFQGADGKWRFEIPDQHAELAAPSGEANRSYPLSSAVDHPELARAYPDLMAEGRLVVQDPRKEGLGRNGAYTPASEEVGREKVYLTSTPDALKARSTMLHELQHAVQQREGFAPGSSPQAMQHVAQPVEDARKLIELGSPHEFAKATGRQPHPAARELVARLTPEELAKVETDPYELYRRVAGEVEARNVQARRDFDPVQRTKPPWATEDVPREKQLIGAPHDPAAPTADAAPGQSGAAADAGPMGSGRGGAGGNASLPEAQAAAAGRPERQPYLEAAVRVGDKLYKGVDHLDALSKVPPELKAQAQLDGSNRGWVNDRGRFLNRERAQRYAVDNGLIKEDAPSWVARAPEAVAEWIKPRATPPAAGGLPEAQATAARWAGERKPLEGLPGPLKIGDEHFVPGPIGKIHDVAEDYMRTHHPDRPYTPPTRYHPLDPEHSKAIAQAYEEMQHTPNDPATRASYDALIKETADQYQAIKKTGLKIEPILPGMEDPYAANPRLAAKDVAENNHLWYFPTESGFGTVNKISDNPMLRKTGEKIGDHELLANDMFRIVHDYFGHLKEGHGFRAAGEDNAWRTHSAMYSDIARPAMTTETRGQNSWVNYGPHGEKNRKANAADTTYADQKVGLMPEWVMRDRGSPAPVMVYHGTPHSFDRFDISKIGEGEGNQAYGHGLYFAGHEPVSEWYRHQLAARQDPLLKKYKLQDVGHVIGSHLSDFGGDAQKLAAKYADERNKLIASGDDTKATTNMIDEYARRIKYLENPKRSRGHMYQVGMEVNPEHLLDYDLPFNDQSQHVQGRTGPEMEASVKKQIEAIDRILARGGEGGTGGLMKFRPLSSFKRQDLEGRKMLLEQTGPASLSGKDIYTRMGLPAISQSEGAVKSAQKLRSLDVPGLRYRDAGSRAPGQQGSHNYVMFGDDMLKILRKYGVVGIPATGVLGADGEERRARGGKVNRALQIARRQRADGGAAFGVLSPAEEAERPEGVPAKVIRGAAMNLATLPKRAYESSQRMVETGEYDPAPILEAATLPMGTGAMAGVRALPGEMIAGSGPVRRLVDDTGAAMTPTRRYAEPEFTPGGSRIINKGVENPPDPSVQTVADPHRMMFPGVYRNPRILAEEAAARVGEEDPAMKRLFGVTRGDLRDMARGRVGNEEPVVPPAGARSRGALSAQNIQTPQNTQRLQDILAEAGRHEGLRTADAWYIMDPVYRRMVELHGPEAAERYRRLNTMTGMASPGSDVMTEIQRGTGAHWLNEQGRFGDFQKYAGVPEAMRSSQRYPADLRYIAGHPYHRTSQGEPMAKYLEHGSIQSDAPKVPLYVHASGVPETGFQTTGPVGDAHFSRGVGLSDTRKGPSDVQGSFSKSEYQTLQPWWQHEVAGEVGLESVPAQARLWTALGPQTGVESELGAPKLELLAKQIMTAAKRLRVSPETARDMVLSGKAGAGVLAGGMLAPSAIDAMRDHHADGGKVSSALALARGLKRARGGKVHTGAIMGDTDGRADEVPMEVPDGSYVLTADHVSSMGEGNTLGGFKKLDQMFPKSAAAHTAQKTRKRASGGAVPIYAADGEYVICPEDITDRWGDLEAGHRYLDAWQTASRKEHVNTLRNLAPPAQD